MLQRGDETLEHLRATGDGARLGQAQGHTEQEVRVATNMGTER